MNNRPARAALSVLLVAASAQTLAACTTVGGYFDGYGRQRASFDLHCPAQQLQPTALTGSLDDRVRVGAQVGVTGCGRRGTYVVTNVGWVLNGASEQPAEPAPPVVASAPAAGQCSSIPATADPGVRETIVSAPMRAAQPGSVADGTYRLSGYEWHVPGDHNATRHIVMRIANGQLEMVFGFDGQAPSTLAGTVRFSADGTMNIAATCPQAGTLEFDRYAVTPEGVVLISTSQSKAATFSRVSSI